MSEDTDKKKEAEKQIEAVPKYKVLTLAAYGGAKHVRVDNVEIKKPRNNEVEVTVEACGMNFLDIMDRQGLSGHNIKPPYKMGLECCGMVTAIGEDVTQYKVGDRVVVLVENGAWAERINVPVKSASENATEAKTIDMNDANAVVLPWPGKANAAQAALMPYAYLPAYMLLHQVAFVQSGNVVLVTSAGGGVGTALAQLSKQIKDVKLIGIASQSKHEKLSTLYDALLTPEQDCVAEVKKLYPNGIDVVFDCLSGEWTTKLSGLLKPLGRHVFYGMSSLVSGERKNVISLAKHWFHCERIQPSRLHEENRTISGFCLRSLLFDRTNQRAVKQDLVRKAWNELIRLIDERSIDPWIDSEWGFDQVKEAMSRLQERKNIGKVVLLPKKEPSAS